MTARRRLARSIGAVASAAALLAVAAGSAIADPINPASLVPALDVYVDAIAAGHAAAAACTPAASPARDEAAWAKAKAMFIATLWANGFPIVFVRTAGQRLDAVPQGPKPDCTDPAIAASLGSAPQEGWPATMQRPLAGMDLRIILQPVDAAGWEGIKAAFAREIPAQKRLFDCVAVSTPEMMPLLVHDWDQMLIRIGQKLADAGLPRDEVSAQLSAAEANALWHRVAPDAEAGLRDSCAADKAWQQRIELMQFLGLSAAVDKLLPPPAPPDSGSN